MLPQLGQQHPQIDVDSGELLAIFRDVRKLDDQFLCQVAGGANLIVCVDCGSTSFEALQRAKDRGADVVVLDHHQVGMELPPAVAIVNPSRPTDVSGQGNLAAVGVTFMTAVALLRELRRRNFAGAMPDLLPLLELVALGTVCDMVPLSGLNRALVNKGLIALRHTERVGLRGRMVLNQLLLYARPQERSRDGRGAEGATAPETLRQKDRGRKGALESSG